MKKIVIAGSMILMIAITMMSCDQLASNPFTTISGVYEVNRGQLTKLNPPPQQYISASDTYPAAFFNVTLIVVGMGDGSIQEPDFLNTVRRLQDTIEKHVNEVGETVSVVDYVSAIHREFNKSQKGPASIPDNKTLIAQYLFLYENINDDTLPSLTNPTHSKAMIYIKKKTPNLSDGFVDTIVEEVKRFSTEKGITIYISTEFPPEALMPLESIKVSDGNLFIGE